MFERDISDKHPATTTKLANKEIPINELTG